MQEIADGLSNSLVIEMALLKALKAQKGTTAGACCDKVIKVLGKVAVVSLRCDRKGVEIGIDACSSCCPPFPPPHPPTHTYSCISALPCDPLPTLHLQNLPDSG